MVRYLTEPAGRIGLLGGTFDPPHLGHIRAASGAANELELDQVAFLPAPHPPHKQGKISAAYKHRRRMVELCLDADPRFRLCLIEERGLPGTTVETVKELRCSGYDEEHCHLVWLMGSDSLLDLRHWHQPNELFKIVDIAIMPRPGFPIAEAESGFLHKVRLLNTPLIDMAASDLRRGEGNLSDWVYKPVADYIVANRLYGFK